MFILLQAHYHHQVVESGGDHLTTAWKKADPLDAPGSSMRVAGT